MFGDALVPTALFAKAKLHQLEVYTASLEYSLNTSRLNGSTNALDAMFFSRRGDTLLFYLRLSGIVVQEEWRLNEAHATECTVIAGGDVSHIARKFAKRCALDVIHLWHAPKVVINYLKSDSEGLLPLALKAAREAKVKANKIGTTSDRSLVYYYALRSALEAMTPTQEASVGLHYTYNTAIWAARTLANYEDQEVKLEQYRQAFEAMAMERFGLK